MSKYVRVGNKNLKKKTIESFVRLHGRCGAVMAISDTYGIDESKVQKIIKELYGTTCFTRSK